ESQTAQRVRPGCRGRLQSGKGCPLLAVVETREPWRQDQHDAPCLGKGNTRRQGSEGFRRALACIDKEAAVDEAMCADGRPHTATDALGQCRNWKLGATSGDSQSLRDRQPQLRARAQANVLAWAGCAGDTLGACG